MLSSTRLLSSFALLVAAVSAAPAHSLSPRQIPYTSDAAPPLSSTIEAKLSTGKGITASTVAATAWHTSKGDRTGYNLGLRVYYHSDDTAKCNGVQELTAWGGAIQDGSAQSFIKTYCFNYAQTGMIPGSALASTSLTEADKLVDLRLFYWAKNAEGNNVIKVVRWSPTSIPDEVFSNDWNIPSIELSHPAPTGKTNHLAALSWMNAQNKRHYSVFYVEDGTWLKEMTMGVYQRADGTAENGWHNGASEACGEALKVDLSKKVKEIGRIQATMWLDAQNIYKRVYVLDASTGKIHEYGSTSPYQSEKTTAEPVQWIGEVKYSGNIKSFAANTDGKGSGLRLFVNSDKAYEVSMKTGAETYRNEFALSSVAAADVTSYERASVSGTAAASAIHRFKDQTYQFVFYSGANNQLMMSQRDMKNWIHGVPVRLKA
ncbi:hypothetical protein FRC02_001555 [Tulasnella sp. 418]|nr:hypothetical protein FRC02_001555 [Tulasnella sp. 418]